MRAGFPRFKRATPALALAMLALVIFLAAPAAEATVMGAAPNGWTTHTGPAYELYISPQQQVGASELSLIVNYGDDNMTLRVTRDGQTVSSTAIAPQSSRFAQLDFASNGTYRIVLANETQELLVLSKTRIIPVTPTPTPPWNDDDWHIIPPGPSPWQPGPDPSQDPLAYTQAAVDELIASVTLESLLTTASLMAIAMFLGAAVQRAVKFIWPTDVITISIVAFAIIQLVGWPSFLVIPGIDSIWWIPVLAGYVIGYIVIGRTRYVMVRRLNDGKSFDTQPWVLYNEDGQTYVQEQTNRALLKRLLFGIKHPILSAQPLEPDYDDTTKYPGFPAFNRKMILVEDWHTYEIMPEGDQESKWWKPRLTRYATEVRTAYGSTVSTYELLRDVRALDKANRALIEAENEIYALHQSLSTRMADTVARFLAKVYSRAPGAVFKDAVERWNSKEKEDNVQKEE